MMNRQALVCAIPQLLMEVSAKRAQGGPEPWLHLDLSMPQLKALMALQSGGMRVGNVAQILGLSANATTSLLDHLEERQLLERHLDPSDRRAVLVQITGTGDELIQGLYRSGAEEMQRLLEDLTDEELRALHLGVSALLQVIRAE